MGNQFLLTYSVNRGNTTRSEDDARTVRYYIDSYLEADSDINDVKKSNYVETSITGEISVQGSTEGEKERNVKKIISKVFENLMSSHDIKKTSIEIYCVLLVHGIKKPIEFKV